MKRHEFNEVLFEEATKALAERFAECKSTRTSRQSPGQKAGLGKARAKGGGFDNMPKAKQRRLAKEGGQSERRSRCEDAVNNSETDSGCLVDMSETLDFAKGTGKPCGNSHISSAYVCRLDAGERKLMTDKLITKGASKAKLDKLSDEQISRVAKIVKEGRLSVKEARQVSAAVDTLKDSKKGGALPPGGATLDSADAKAYAKFYENRQDETFKAKGNTSSAVVKETLKRLKEEDPEAYSEAMKALKMKGGPGTKQLEEAWGSKTAPVERGEAVLKSLMDNEFKDVTGKELPWRTGMQLDHRVPGAQGGKDGPDNWIWISTAANQTKKEADKVGAKAIRAGKSSAEAEKLARADFVTRLKANGKLSQAEVEKLRGGKQASKDAANLAEATYKQNMPLKTPQQRAEAIATAKASDMKALIKASTTDGSKGTYITTVDEAGRTRNNRGTMGAQKAIAKMRWGVPLEKTDLEALGAALKSDDSVMTRSEKLDSIMKKFKGSTGLTAAERIAILKSSE